MSTPDPLPLVLTTLLKGVVYRDANPKVWAHLREFQSKVRDYFDTIGLEVYLDDAEGYAFLRSKPDTDEENPIPRLVARRALSYPVSLMLALLRRKLAEFDVQAAETRLVLSRDQIAELVRIYQPSTANEARALEQVETTINKVVELGFLRRVDGNYEVRRVLKAFIDAQWLSDLNDLLEEYQQ